MKKCLILFIFSILYFFPLAVQADICKVKFTSGNEINETTVHFQKAYSAESLAKRKQLGEQNLKRSLNEKEVEALERAHRAGLGKNGEDGTRAHIGNYTYAQKREKYQILRQAGFSKEEAKKLMQDGVAGWMFWKKSAPPPKPATDLLAELNEEGTKVESTISAYPFRLKEYNDRELRRDYLDDYEYYDEPFKEVVELDIGASYYWSGYLPKESKDKKKPSDEGKFLIGVIIKVVNYGRNTRWIHRIHWNSGARDKKLDPKTIQLIFTELYGGPPEEVIPELQARMNQLSGNELQEEVNGFAVPFIYDNETIEKVKQTVKKFVQERGFQVISETQN